LYVFTKSAASEANNPKIPEPPTALAGRFYRLLKATIKKIPVGTYGLLKALVTSIPVVRDAKHRYVEEYRQIHSRK
jgi:hypothetical protein